MQAIGSGWWLSMQNSQGGRDLYGADSCEEEDRADGWCLLVREKRGRACTQASARMRARLGAAH